MMVKRIFSFLFLSALGLSGGDVCALASVNAIEQVTLHPAIPLVDEQGANVLDSGAPYSPRMSCGVGSGGCHDYDKINHGDHFERGRDEADDLYGTKRGLWSHLGSPGYFGGFNSEGPAILAKKTNGGADAFPADWGAPGMVMACIECHNGGGWSELDRDGIRYDQKMPLAVAPWDGDYFNRGTTSANLPAAGSVVSRWDWSKSGVVENDCLMCHGDYARLKVFPNTVASALDPNAWYVGELTATPSQAFGAWWNARNVDLVKAGYFRDAATALLEFIDVGADDANSSSLVRLERSPSGEPVLVAGKPHWIWNAAAFDPATRKVQIPMRKFPANDNCWQCHGNKVGQNRRGFWGYGEAARPERESVPGPSGNARPIATGFDWRSDVHKGAKFIENSAASNFKDVERIIDNCNACHTQGIYYRPLDTNVDLNADHNFAKGNADIDIRRDLDFRPGAKSCEYCHDQAVHKANPSDPTGRLSLANVHLQRWTALGYMVGFSGLGLINTHLDSVSCQTCHIPGNPGQCDINASSATRADGCDARLKDMDGSNLPIMYRSRVSEDGTLKTVPYIAKYQFRYFWRDRISGRILTEQELNSVYSPKKDAGGKLVGLLLTARSGKQFELSGGQRALQGANAFYDWGPQFKPTELYEATQALKAAYDQLLTAAGYTNPNVQMIWTESNDYLITHGTQPVANVLPCQGCHDRSKAGVWSGTLKAVYSEKKQIVFNQHADKRLVDSGVVVLDKPYYKVTTDGKIVANEVDILTVSQNDPSMTALLADKASLSEGEFARVSLDEALSRMSGTDTANREVLAPLLGASEQLVFDPVTGQNRLKQLTVSTPADSGAVGSFGNTRVTASVRTHTTVDSRLVVKSRLGVLASEVFGLEVRSPQRHVLSTLNEPVWVKLPYFGTMCAPGQVNVVDLSTVSKAASSKVVLLKPKPGQGTNYAVFTTDRPLSRFVLTDQAANPRLALRKASSALARSKRAKSAVERRAGQLKAQLVAADTAALAASTAAIQAQGNYDSATDGEKQKLLAALNKAKSLAVTTAVRANQLRAQSEAADAASAKAGADFRDATLVEADAKACVN